MDIRTFGQIGPTALYDIEQTILQRNASPSGPRAPDSTDSPVEALGGIRGMTTVPGFTEVSSPAGIVATPGQTGLGAPMVFPYVSVGGGLGLNVDALA